MAGIFQPTLQTEVQFERAVEEPSTIGILSQLGSGFVDSFARSQRANAPSSADVRAAADAENLKSYTAELDELHQMRDQIAPDRYNAQVNQLNSKYYGMGVDVGSATYSNARKLITGLEDDQLTLTDNERLINEFQATAEGQGQIAFAANQLSQEGLEVNSNNIATVLREREETQAAVATLKIENEASLMQSKPVIKALTDQFQKDTQNAYFTLREQGIPVTPAMIQDRYVDFLSVRSEIESKIPANAPLAQKEDILKDLTRMDDFFVQLGMDRKDGEIVLRTQNELQLEGKMNTFLSVLGESDNAADISLALKMSDPNYNLQPADYALMQGRLAGLGSETDITPDWIQEADIVVTNDLIQTYNNLIEFETSGARAVMDQEAKQRAGALSLVNPEEQAKWLSLTNAQGWTSTKAFSQASKGFSKEAILSGQMTDGFYNTMAGLALSFETIDIMEEPISFAGVRKEVSSKLPDLIKTAEAVDPAKGAAIRGLMYRSLVTQRFQYDTRIASDEAALGIKFNTNTGAYNLDSNTSDPQKLKFIEIVNNKYGGSLEKLFEDNFRSIAWSDFPEDQARAMQMSGQTPQMTARSIFGQYLPNEGEYKEVLDLRNSAVYLNNLATQIEPQASKDAREAAAIAAEAVDVVQTEGATSNGSVSESLGIDFGKYESDAGLPAGFLERTAQIESSGDPTAKNPNSSAGGLFQQIDSNAKQYGVTDRFDPVQSTEGAVKFAQDNQRELRSFINREPTAAELYLAHQQGGRGAGALLGNSEENVVEVLTRVYGGNAGKARDAVRLNGGNENMTAGEFANIWINKFNRG